MTTRGGKGTFKQEIKSKVDEDNNFFSYASVSAVGLKTHERASLANATNTISCDDINLNRKLSNNGSILT